MEEMNCSKRGRPFAYPDLLTASIVYLRCMIGKGARITEGIVDGILGKDVKVPTMRPYEGGPTPRPSP